MTEALLQFIWKFQLFNASALQTVSGEPVQVIRQGVQNFNSGPDFLNAKIKIGNQVWAGNIELHVNGKDWLVHGHQHDAAYNNVVLHVTLETDSDFVQAANGAKIHCAALRTLLSEHLLSRYEELMSSTLPIPCANRIKSIDEFVFQTELEKRAVERLEQKVSRITDLLAQSKNDWEQVAWQMVARYLGGNINKEPMEAIFHHLPVSVMMKHADSLPQLEAMIFGVAGLLRGKFLDDYPQLLQREFNYLKRLHSLHEMESGVFRWAKVRPAGFPSVRLAQIAALCFRTPKLFSALLHCSAAGEVNELLACEVSAYWVNHYRFDEQSKKSVKRIGTTAIHSIVVNAIAPLLFAYGKHKGEEKFCDNAIYLLTQLPPESNHVIKVFEGLQLKPKDAFQSQGMIQLKNNYCNNFQCLNCSVGSAVLGKL